MKTLRNSYHNTEAKTRLTDDDLARIQDTHPAEWTPAERQTVYRLRRKLCGVQGCTCGDTFGSRGL